MLKVMHVSSDWTMGGAGRYILSLVEDGDRSSFEHLVACPEGGEFACLLRARGIRVLPLRVADRSFHSRTVGEVCRFIGRERPDIVHTHGSLSGRVAARLAGARAIVLTRHGLDPQGRSVARRVANFLGGVGFADAVIAISAAVKRDLVAGGVPAGKISVIRSGVRLAEVSAAEAQRVRRELGLEDGILVGAAGRLSAEKGFDCFTRAASRVHAVEPAARFVLAGEGPMRAGLERTVGEAGLEGVFVFAGYRREITALLAAMDVGVVPSRREGLGLVLLELMALGKPVVATRTGGIPEVVVDGVSGLLVEPDDAAALAGAVLAIVRDPGLARRLGAAARERVSAEFSVQSMVRETERLYRRCAGCTE